MSYNISNFILKKVNLTLPVGFNFKDWAEDRGLDPWNEMVVSGDMKTWEINEGGEGFSLSGIMEPEGFIVESIDCSGEGSGSDYRDYLLPLFAEYGGDLEASVVWECGDSIEKIKIRNGKVSTEKVDL